MNVYDVVISDFSMYRSPQTVEEIVTVEAVTAEDAITIAKIRHNLPFREKLGIYPNNFHERKLKDVIARIREPEK